jgi:hypothetical protein
MARAKGPVPMSMVEVVALMRENVGCIAVAVREEENEPFWH